MSFSLGAADVPCQLLPNPPAAPADVKEVSPQTMESRSDSTPAWRDPPAVLQPIAPPPAPASASDGPLTADHMQQLATADVRARKLRKAASVAKFNGYTIAVFSVFSLMWGLGELASDGFNPLKLDWLTFTIGAGLGAIAWNELRGRKLLTRFDPRAARLLGLNQVGLMVLIVAYAAWMLYQTATGQTELDQAIRQHGLGASDIAVSIIALAKLLTELVYELLIALTIIFQGLNAVYYFTRAKLLRSYVAETPAWVIELQRTQAGSLQ